MSFREKLLAIMLPHMHSEYEEVRMRTRKAVAAKKSVKEVSMPKEAEIEAMKKYENRRRG